jgi:hypothetical protein
VKDEEVVRVMHFVDCSGQRLHEIEDLLCWCNPKILRDVSGAYLVYHQDRSSERKPPHGT